MATNSHIFANVPSENPSIRAAYETWLKAQTDIGRSEPTREDAPSNLDELRVGIVGAGMAGLYSALLLQSRGIKVHIFEENPSRIGGRIYTHRFTDEAKTNQYFEAGAMRLPDIPEQQPVFDLIEYLNEWIEESIKTIDYILYSDKGNRVFVNGTRQEDGQVMTVNYAKEHPDELGFPLKDSDRNKTADELLNEVLEPFIRLLNTDFQKGFQEIIKYDSYSLYAYLSIIAGWSEDKINYVEVMTSQTNQFHNSFTELVIENIDFSKSKWKTIENGMDILPNACAELIGFENITMGAKVYRLEERDDGKIEVYHFASNEPAVFDKVIIAVPPAVLKMWQTPQWSARKNAAIRALHFEPLYKIGLRFKTRFWEKVSNPSRGGQSITDLPSRWFVYPSYGIGEEEPGVLLLYSWMTDAYAWLPQSKENRERIALRDLQRVYQEINIQDEFIESFDVAWSVEWSTGDAMFFPGQFRTLFNAAREPEGNIYFAGEHLSVHHTWIVGALDSALLACQQLLGDPSLQPLRNNPVVPHTYDYSFCREYKTLSPSNTEKVSVQTVALQSTNENNVLSK